MKIKTLFLVLFLTCSFNWGFCQNQTVLSKVLDIGRYTLDSFVGGNDQMMYAVGDKSNYSKFGLVQLDRSDYSTKWIKDLDAFPRILGSGVHSGYMLYYIKHKLIVISAVYNRKKKTIKICSQVGTEDGVFEAPKILTESPFEKYLESEVSSSFMLSPDSTCLLICHARHPYYLTLSNPKLHEEVTATVINLSDVSFSYTTSPPRTYKDYPLLTSDYFVDNKGNLIYSFSYFTDIRKSEGGKAIAFLKKGSQLPSVKAMDMEKGITYGASTLVLRKNGTYALAGLFTDPSKPFTTPNMGVYYTIFNYEKNEVVKSGKVFLSNGVADKINWYPRKPEMKYQFDQRLFRTDKFLAMNNELCFVFSSRGFGLTAKYMMLKIGEDGVPLPILFIRELPFTSDRLCVLYTNTGGVYFICENSSTLAFNIPKSKGILSEFISKTGVIIEKQLEELDGAQFSYCPPIQTLNNKGIIPVYFSNGKTFLEEIDLK
jgi:hypothetical protein